MSDGFVRQKYWPPPNARRSSSAVAFGAMRRRSAPMNDGASVISWLLSASPIVATTLGSARTSADTASKSLSVKLNVYGTSFTGRPPAIPPASFTFATA